MSQPLLISASIKRKRKSGSRKPIGFHVAIPANTGLGRSLWDSTKTPDSSRMIPVGGAIGIPANGVGLVFLIGLPDNVEDIFELQKKVPRISPDLEVFWQQIVTVRISELGGIKVYVGARFLKGTPRGLWPIRIYKVDTTPELFALFLPPAEAGEKRGTSVPSESS